ncbi:MAG: nitroreductase/quinone reductase family protein [Actinomycetota bacterium]|nr:nitroreductase/quinone reductase family protein [Actinomycetota bacterium]
MARWPISDDDARAMYAGGRADDTARWYARLWGRIFAIGLFPRRWVTLEVPGRVTGRLQRVPLGMADENGRWYLVSMLGECNWVRNTRANQGHVVLRRRRAVNCRLVEVPPSERAPMLRRYVAKVPGGRPHIPVPKGAPLAEFAAVADRFPVFAVLRETSTGMAAWSTRRSPW